MTDTKYAAVFDDIVAAAAAQGFGPSSYRVVRATDALRRAFFDAEMKELSFREGSSK